MNVGDVYKAIYIIALIINIIFMFAILEDKSSGKAHGLIKIFISTLLMLLGYWFKAESDTPQGFIFSQKLIFMGSSFVPYYLLNVLAEFCGIKFKNWVRTILGLTSLFLCAIMLSFDYTSIVYKTMEFEKFRGSYRLITENGIGMYIFRTILIIDGIGMLQIIIKGFDKNSARRTRQSFFLLTVPMILGVLYITEIIVNPEYDLIPVGVLVTEIILAFLLFYEQIFDITDTVKDQAFENTDDVLIALNPDLGFQACNPEALKLFPELRGLSVNEELDEEKFATILALAKGETVELKSGEKVYECSVRDIKIKDIVRGSIVWLSDVTNHRNFVELMRNYQIELEHMVDEKVETIIQIQSSIMTRMADVIENRDGNTGGHVKRTRQVVKMLTDAMLEDAYAGITEEYCRLVVDTAPLHDLGKLSIEDRILRKPGKLSDEEYDVMKMHSTLGKDMVAQILEGIENDDVLQITENIALYHHEKWDGTGYPQKLSHEEIPLEARIMAIADVYDALVSKRAYKDPMPPQKAYDIINESFGTAFDPGLKKYFDMCREDIEKFYISC